MNGLFSMNRETDLENGGLVRGVAVAVVTDNKDPEGLGRVRVRFPWHGDSAGQSHWARIAVPMAGKEIGTWFLPDVSDEVAVVFEREDIRFPFVIGSLWNGQEPPPETNSDGKNERRLIRSRKKHELLFVDGDKGLVELKLNDGKHLLFDDDGIILEDGKGNILQIESNSGAITIKSTGKITMESPQVSIKASGTMELKASGTMTIKGSIVQIN